MSDLLLGQFLLIKECIYCAVTYIITVDRRVDPYCTAVCPKCENTLKTVACTDQINTHYKKVEINYSEFYEAINGFGFKNESEINEDELKTILLFGTVKDTILFTSPNNRIVIKRLSIEYNLERFELFFEASGYGAVIYKIIRSKL